MEKARHVSDNWMVLCCLGTTCSWQLTHLHIQGGGRGIQPFQNPTEDRPSRIPTLSAVALLSRPDHARWQIRNRKKEAPLLLAAWLFRRERKNLQDLCVLFPCLVSCAVHWEAEPPQSNFCRTALSSSSSSSSSSSEPQENSCWRFSLSPESGEREREASRRRTRLSAQLS